MGLGENVYICTVKLLKIMNYQKLTSLIIALLTSLYALADVPIRARFLNANNGLGTNNARVVVQDPKGYIWIGTTNGLVRYDGYSAQLLTPSDAPNRRLMHDSRIQDMRLHNDRYLLLRLRGDKISCYDTQTDCFIACTEDVAEVFKHGHQANTAAKIEKGNGGWSVSVGTGQQVTHINGIYSETLQRLNGKPRINVLTDREGYIWISTYGNGLFLHNRKSGETTHYTNKSYAAPIQTDYLTGLYEDRNGNIWVYQENMGLACITKQHASTEMVFFTTPEQTDHTNSIRLLTNVGGTIYVGNLYNGTKMADGNLNFQKTLTDYRDDLLAVCRDKQGNTWVGTRKSGVFTEGQVFHNPRTDGRGNKKVSDIICDRKGRIWISFFDGGIDMAEKDQNGGYHFRHFFTDSASVQHPRQLMEDHGGYIWLTSNEGIFVFHPDRLINNSKDYRHILINEKAPQLDEIRCITEDSMHHIMVGTQGSGLAELDNQTPGKTRLLRTWTTADGLPDNNIQQLITDGDGHVWIGTDHGLARYSPKSHSFMKLPAATMALSNMFIENAVCALDDGRIAFGTYHGILVVNPHSLPQNSHRLPLATTGLDINGIPLQQLEDSTLFVQLKQAHRLQLAYNQNSLTFYFSDFNYADEEGSRYSYRLVGYDRDWSALSPINFATYKNLPPGKYTMEIRSMGDNGQWNDKTESVDIIIRPPLWRTWWAYLIYIIVLASLGWFVWRYFKRTNDLQNRIKVETQLTEYKLRFFTNISHEFRTPLTIIRGAMERMAAIGDMPGDMKQPVSTMRKSVDRMMRLINELLEFRKMQNNKLQLALEETDVVGFIKEIYLTFYQTAENKHMNYTFLPFAHQYTMYIDKSFVDKIVYNLLSNAFKYTMAHHSVTLRITHDEEAQTIGIIVEDTGIGVPKEKQAALFTRFNQSTYTQDSIGVGLHLVNELVRVHHGQIEFRENPEGGAIFTVTLPTDRNRYEEKDFLVEGNDLLREQNENKQPNLLTDYKEMASEPLNDRRILIVEDDDGIRDYMVNELSHFFMIDTASNGQEALEKLHAENSERPDLIVSDVLMPIMNGYELTRAIRTDKETADIPIILLTALTAEEKKIKGLDSGADAYVEKPFSMKVLVAKCRQLISQRDQLRMKYAKEVVGRVEVPEVLVDEQDKKLRDLLDTWLSAHISDSNLSIDQFAEKMGYGRTTFYKKVKKLTGQTPNDYIKSRRMERAIELLKDDTLTVAEVSYQIGIEDPFYFSKSFKSYFGISPSQYRKGEKPKPKDD